MKSQKETSTSAFKTRQEMAKELGISISTFRRKLKAKNIALSGGLLNLEEQSIVYCAFGLKRLSPQIEENKEISESKK